MIKQTYDLPVFERLTDDQLKIIQEITLPTEKVDAHNTNNNSAQITALLNSLLLNNLSIANLEITNRHIKGFSDSSMWHIDYNQAEPTILLASLRFPTQFAACNIIYHESIVDYMNSIGEKEQKKEKFLGFTTKSFQGQPFKVFEQLALTNAVLQIYFGENWLFDAAQNTNSDLSALVSVSNLAIAQALPGIVAIGNCEKTLHRQPSSPITNNRPLLRAFA